MPEHAVSGFSRLKDVRFPDEISALGHILELIDEMLMTREEAVVKAAGTNQLEWLEYLFGEYDGDYVDAVTSAAAKGYVEVVIRIIQGINRHESESESDSDSDSDSDDLESVSDKARPLLKKAIVTAARNGQLNIITVFLPQLGSGRGEKMRELYTTTWEVLDEGAAHGHLNVVAHVVDFATQWGYIEEYTPSFEGDALLLAISGGHGHVAKFLLQECLIEWNAQDALDEAVHSQQNELVEWIPVCALQFSGGKNSGLCTE
ncbi:hypothetical protein PF008_g27382 [Phytophthora fragariae]|uniref:Uncharacterized protein n=1 Tax=Phytophthora fragariae TaxID=53985 RepID=A0A6G0QF71_9STRA|nr:hypothetical protein PF008_g27382 [Phytophthora fragariae]